MYHMRIRFIALAILSLYTLADPFISASFAQGSCPAPTAQQLDQYTCPGIESCERLRYVRRAARFTCNDHLNRQLNSLQSAIRSNLRRLTRLKGRYNKICQGKQATSVRCQKINSAITRYTNFLSHLVLSALNTIMNYQCECAISADISRAAGCTPNEAESYCDIFQNSASVILLTDPSISLEQRAAIAISLLQQIKNMRNARCADTEDEKERLSDLCKPTPKPPVQPQPPLPPADPEPPMPPAEPSLPPTPTEPPVISPATPTSTPTAAIEVSPSNTPETIVTKFQDTM